MQFVFAYQPFLPEEFEHVQTVWLVIKMSDWPFLSNTIDMMCWITAVSNASR